MCRIQFENEVYLDFFRNLIWILKDANKYTTSSIFAQIFVDIFHEIVQDHMSQNPKALGTYADVIILIYQHSNEF